MSDISQSMRPTPSQEGAPNASDKFEQLARELGGTARSEASEAKERLSSIAETARARFTESVEPLKDKAKEVAEQRKAAGAATVSGLARAVHGAADDLESQLPQAAGYIHDAAGALDRASAALKERSIEDLIGTFGQFARTQPAAFFGTAVLAGFALSRFLKSSAATSRDGAAGPNR